MRRLRFAAPLMLGLAAATLPVLRAHAQISISVTVAPPVLPVYDQPQIPEAGYLWAPGYWAWSDIGYYWVPGTWVLPPQPGLLWTPGYWGCNPEGVYVWNAGYWAPNVGFYGGVNYGYGYGGNGYQGGYWQQNHFFYNRNANNFGNTHITNVYERNVTNVTVNRVSYNGGNGGIDARPSQQEMAYRSERHFDPTSDQLQQQHLAAGNRDLWASQNHGRPAIAATPRPADFTAHDVVPARNAASYVPPPQHAGGAMAPQHPVNAMQPQRPENGMAPQHENSMMAPQRPAGQTPRPMAPGSMGINRPAENVQHAQPAYHAPEAPAVHEPAPQAYHPEQMAPRPVEAPRPQGMQQGFHAEQPRPEQARPEQARPQGGERPPEPEHKPN